MNIETIAEKIKTNKWWFWIPVLGTIAYALFVEMPLADPSVDKSLRKGVKKYKSIFALGMVVINLPMIILAFTVNVRLGNFNLFWAIAIIIGGLGNLSFLTNRYLYLASVKKLK